MYCNSRNRLEILWRMFRASVSTEYGTPFITVKLLTSGRQPKRSASKTTVLHYTRNYVQITGSSQVYIIWNP